MLVIERERFLFLLLLQAAEGFQILGQRGDLAIQSFERAPRFLRRRCFLRLHLRR